MRRGEDALSVNWCEITVTREDTGKRLYHNLLAFLFHTLLNLLDEQYRAVRQELVARQEFFNDLRALLRYMVFDSWKHLMHFMLVGLELIPDT